MRYIGRTQTSTLVQVDPDKNSYVNIKSFGAAGLDRYFEGRVGGVGGNGNIISIGDIAGYPSFEKEYLKLDQELYAFFYLENSAPPLSDYENIFTNIGDPYPVGDVRKAGTLTSKSLVYYVYAFNPVTGKFSPYAKTFTLSNVYKDPLTQFDEENYVRITFTRKNSQWLPVIYRQWGAGSIKFLGIPGNNILGNNTSISFNDRGTAQIPSWDEQILNEGGGNPELLENIIINSGNLLSAKTIILKRRLRIQARSQSGVLECVDADSSSGVFTDLDNASIRVKFKIDDTRPIQKALEFAAKNNIKDIFIPSGTYSVTNLRLYGSEIQAKEFSDIIIRGSGESSILKKMPTHVNPQNQYGFIGLLGSGITNRPQRITIRNLSFDGNKSEVFSINVPEGDTYGIGDKYSDFLAMEYADEVRITDCSFYDNGGSAVYALNSDKINFTNNRVFRLSKPYELNISPLKIRESSRFIAQGNLFQNCSGAIDLTGLDTSVINNNIIENCGETGLQLNASDTWNAQGNLTFNENGSIIRSIDLYQNDYSRVNLDVKRGVAMTPVFFTVTDGGLPVAISSGTINAQVWPLNSSYTRNTGATAAHLQVIESGPQLNVGIFGITAPISSFTGSGTSNQGKNIKGTNDYDLLKPDGSSSANYGYGYRITAKVTLGRFPVRKIERAAVNTVKIFFKNTSDYLSLVYFAGGDIDESDAIKTFGIGGIPGSAIENWPDGNEFQIQGTDPDNAAIIITTPSQVSSEFVNTGSFYNTPTGYMGIIRDNYFVSDGNIYVSD
jgi:hypothetical protein